MTIKSYRLLSTLGNLFVDRIQLCDDVMHHLETGGRMRTRVIITVLIRDQSSTERVIDSRVVRGEQCANLPGFDRLHNRTQA